MLNIVFFAALREQLNCEKITIEATNINTVADIKQILCEKGVNWQDTLSNSSLLSAVNHDMVSDEHQVESGDEVAFFPPVTGG